jgi:hypothetical protein
MGRPANAGPFHASVDLSTLECDKPEAKGNVKDLLASVLSSCGFSEPAPGKFTTEDLQSMADAEMAYFKFFKALRGEVGVDYAENDVGWVPSTKIKEIRLRFGFR